MATTDMISTKQLLLARYKEELPKFWEDEKYKWEAVKHFQDNWDIDASDFGAMFTEATKKHYNLLASGMYYAQAMILEFAAVDVERTRSMFRNLFDESLNLKTRIQSFMDECESIRKSHSNEWKNHYQDLHAISVYLTFMYPERYFIYKYTELKNYVNKAGDSFVVRRSNKPDYLADVLDYMESIRAKLVGDEELTKLIADLTAYGNCYSDDHKNITTVDFVYYVGKRMLDKPALPHAENETEQSKKPRFWIYAPGESAYKWDFCLEEDLICIGWEELGDVSSITSLEQMRTKMQSVFGEDKPYKNSGLAVWEFSHVMKPGDIIYAKRGLTKIIGKGIVTGDYTYDESLEEYNHVRAIQWTHEGLWEAPWNLPMKTLTEISAKNAEDLDAMLNGKAGGKSTPEEDGGTTDNSIQYWWLVAKPSIWRMTDMMVSDEQEYTIYNDNGNRRRVFQNFLNAREGDIVIGYEATPTKQIVALLKVARANDGQTIVFQKTESLPVPIDYATIKSIPELAGLEFFQNATGSFFKVTEEEYNSLMDIIREDNPIKTEVAIPSYTEEDFLNEVFIDRKQYDRLKSLLMSKKNIILQGAPGVGKTFSAKRLAFSVMGMKDEQRIELIQFHQSYTYEDFIMGYKPNDEGGFYLKKGVFYTFCKKAKADPSRPYFFIIDEINRGNLSKIFGELLMLIEKDYRNTPIKLAYTDELFDVPDNVHIIGMMNTADRSLAMIDYALRRRFSFFDMSPGFDSEGFKNYQAQINDPLFDKAIEAVVALNKVISNDASLGKGFCIGHSYFCNRKIFSHDWLENVICYDLLPMLREYWFDNDEQYNSQSNALLSILQ